MRRLTTGVATALTALVLAACGGSGVKVAPGAVRELGAIVGTGAGRTLDLSAAQVTELAGAAHVSDDAIRTTAEGLDQTGRWSRWTAGVKKVYRDTPDDIRSNVLGLACDGATGRITSEQEFDENLRARFAGYGENELAQFADGALSLWRDLKEASESPDPDQRAAAVLACYTVEQVTG